MSYNWTEFEKDDLRKDFSVKFAAVPHFFLRPRRRKSPLRGLHADRCLKGKKAEFFESVVDVLERDYGVSIIEKPRGKSSGKSKKRG